MTSKSNLGKKGEDLAAQYIARKGYEIITRNFRKPWGEIDIVAQCKDGTLVFFEIKTMKEYPGEGILPEDQLTSAKLHKVKKSAAFYAGYYPEKINERKGWRIDLITLTIRPKSCIIKHYENVS